jgi:hypothetical protein
LARADFPLTNATLDTSVGRVELTSAGTGQPRLVMVPGTGFNAEVALPWPRALISPAGFMRLTVARDPSMPPT